MKTKDDRVTGRRSGREGQTFVVVMMLTGILMIAGASLTYLTSNASHSSRKINNGARAQAIAEAGIADRISKMTTNYNGWANASNTVSYAGGTFTVIGTQATNLVNVVIRSTGVIGGDRRTVVLELLGTLYMLWNLTVDVDGAIVSDGNVTLSNPATIHGDIRSNGSILQGSSAEPNVEGDIQCHGPVCEVDGTGTEVTNAPPIGVPDYRLELDLWRARAMTDTNYYFTNSVDFSGVGPGGASLAPTSGVIFVDGNVTISRKVPIRGTMVAMGWVKVEQQDLDWTLPTNVISISSNWPCIIANLSFECQNQNSYPGTIFAGTSIYLANRREVHGCLISMGTVSVQNDADIWAPGGAPAWDPNDTNKAAPPIIPGAWLQ